MKEGDILWYCDSARKSPDSVERFLELVHKSKSGILVYPQTTSQGKATKADVFLAAKMDIHQLQDYPQLFAGTFFLQKRGKDCDAEKLILEWLRLCQVPGLIDDSPSKSTNTNKFYASSFKHDQAVFSLLAYKHGAYVLQEDSEIHFTRKEASRNIMYRFKQLKENFVTQIKDAISHL